MRSKCFFVGICLLISMAVSSVAVGRGSKDQEGFAIMQTKEESAARAVNNCLALKRNICRSSITHKCTPVYTSGKDDPVCEHIDARKIARVCGSGNAELFGNDKECLNIQPSADCPVSIDDIKQEEVPSLYRCPELYDPLCKRLCGARYDGTDIREFYQTGGKPGLTCIDGSRDEMKNGEGYTEDRERHNCFGGDKSSGSGSEIHRAASGTRKWCIKYNHSYSSVNFGAYVQCVGRLR